MILHEWIVFIARFWISTKVVYLQRWHGWCTRIRCQRSQSRRVLCTPYNHAPCHFMQSHIRKVYACLAVTCHLRFWQSDRGLLRATAVTRGLNGYRNKSQHRKLTLEKKILPPFQQDSNPRPFNHESGALTTELSPPPCRSHLQWICKQQLSYSFHSIHRSCIHWSCSLTDLCNWRKLKSKHYDYIPQQCSVPLLLRNGH